MRLRHNIAVAADGLRRRPLQALLLCLTAAAGIGAVVATISVVGGGTNAFMADMSKLGVDVITVTIPRSTTPEGSWQLAIPGMGDSSSRRTVNESDAEELRRYFGKRDVKISLAMLDVMPVSAGEKDGVSIVLAVDTEFMPLLNLPLNFGRYFNESDGAAVCLIDKARANELFGAADVVGRKISLGTDKPVELEIIGVVTDPLSLRSQLEQYDTGSVARDIATQHLMFKNIYVLRGAFDKIEGLSFKPIPLMLIKPGGLETLQGTRAEAEKILNERGVGFLCFTMDTWLEKMQHAANMINSSMNIIWVVIVIVACVLIASVGVLAVRGRFREIAIRRVEGATRRDIMLQIGMESIIISAAGGCVGVGGGILAALAVSKWVVDWPSLITFGEVGVALGLAAFVGLFTAVVPALRAARVDPAAVLRNW